MRNSILFLFFLFPSFSQGQDSIKTEQLKAVQIKENAIDENRKGEKTIKKLEIRVAEDANDLLKPLNNWLQYHSNAYVQSSGINSSATLSIRGASAAQTGLFWNDVPIRNTQSGMTDLNSFPNFFFDESWIMYGGKGSIQGAGTMGGALQLYNNRLSESKNVLTQFLLKTNNLLNNDIGTKLAWRIGNSEHHIKLAYSNFKNKFKYESLQGENIFLEHATSEKIAWMSNHYWNVNTKNNGEFALHAWMHKNKQEIPAARFESHSQKYLESDFVKMQLHYQQNIRNSFGKSSLQFSTENYNYRDWQNEVLAPYDYGNIQWLNHWSYHNYLGNSHWLIKAKSQILSEISWIQVINNYKKQSFKNASIYFSQQVQFEHEPSDLLFDFSLGLDYDQDVSATLLPSFSTRKEFYILEDKESNYIITLGLNIEKGFRKPTLIDLHLFPGGNKELKPEKGWGGDIYIDHKWIKKNFKLEQSVAIYNRRVKNWIYWLGGTIWTPYNIAKVYNRGIESEHSIKWKNEKWQFELQGTTAYNLATTLESFIIDSTDLNKQIPYTPRYQFNGNFYLKYKNFGLHKQFYYVGYRFTTIDESAYLNPYFLMNLGASADLNWKKITFSPSIKIYNIANTSYEIIAFRPLPKRYLEISLLLSI